MEKFIESLEKAEKSLQTIDHLVYVTFPLIRDKRLLLKILLEMKSAVLHGINSILQYEYFYKRISLYKDSKENFRIFREKCAQKYEITKDELDLISELFILVQKHRESGFEFVRHEKVVILSADMRAEVVTLDKIKIFLVMAKALLRKTKTQFLSKI